MMYILTLAIGVFIGHYLSSYKWAKNANDYRRVEFAGKLYKVLLHDDPILNPTEDDINRLVLGSIINKYSNGEC